MLTYLSYDNSGCTEYLSVAQCVIRSVNTLSGHNITARALYNSVNCYTMARGVWHWYFEPMDNG